MDTSFFPDSFRFGRNPTGLELDLASLESPWSFWSLAGVSCSGKCTDLGLPAASLAILPALSCLLKRGEDLEDCMREEGERLGDRDLAGVAGGLPRREEVEVDAGEDEVIGVGETGRAGLLLEKAGLGMNGGGLAEEERGDLGEVARGEFLEVGDKSRGGGCVNAALICTFPGAFLPNKH